MIDKIMMDGEPLERGDPVYSLIHGELTVVNTNWNDTYPIVCERCDGCQFVFNKDFAFYVDTSPRTLFWQKPKILPPPKPKKRVKVWDWFTEDAYGNIKKHAGIPEDYMNNSLPKMQYLTIRQKIDGTEREIEQ